MVRGVISKSVLPIPTFVLSTEHRAWISYSRSPVHLLTDHFIQATKYENYLVWTLCTFVMVCGPLPQNSKWVLAILLHINTRWIVSFAHVKHDLIWAWIGCITRSFGTSEKSLSLRKWQFLVKWQVNWSFSLNRMHHPGLNRMHHPVLLQDSA